MSHLQYLPQTEDEFGKSHPELVDGSREVLLGADGSCRNDARLLALRLSIWQLLLRNCKHL